VDAVMSHHPAYASQDFSWLKSLIDSVHLEDDAERKQRKAEKYVDYDVLEAIPGKIRVFREAYEKKRKKNIKRVARMAMEELMIRWLLILPWRQRNLRECRIGGPAPNLFKGKIPPFSELDKPAWVVEEETRNPSTEFWQIRFSPKETKTRLAIHVLLPRQLIEPLEQYLAEHRPYLVGDRNAETLFMNQSGRAMRADLVEKAIGRWTSQFAGVRTTPHLFRDAVAFKWLKAHPKDFLTLAKLLWHKNVQTTIRIYGSKFNESSGTLAMESWLEERAAKSK
jgi:integrase